VKCKRRQHEHVDHAARVNQYGRFTTIEAIRQDAKQRSEDDRGRELREGYEPDPEFGTGKLPRVPAECHPINPQAVQGNCTAGQVDQELTVAKGGAGHCRIEA